MLGSATFTPSMLKARPSTPNVLKVKCSASTLKVWVDGTLKMTCTTDSDLAWGGVRVVRLSEAKFRHGVTDHLFAL